MVDDENKILTLAKKILTTDDIEVLTADNVEEAMAILDDEGPISVVVSDNRMPDMRGTMFFKKIKTLFPDTVRILMTAHYDAQLIEDVVNTGEAYRYLKKPLDFEVVQVTIQAGIEQHEKQIEEKALAQDMEFFKKEKLNLENATQSMEKKITRQNHLQKILMGSLVMLILGFGTYQVVTVKVHEGRLETSSVKNGHWEKYINGTALDSRTGHIWMARDFRAIEGRAPRDWAEAIAWVDKMNLQRYGGYDDWRLPRLKEYAAIHDPESDRLAFDGHSEHRVSYPESFDNGGGYGYWSMDEVTEKSAAYYFFVGGYSATEKKIYSHPTLSVRLVRR